MSYFAFFYADGDINNKKKRIENLFILSTTILKACKKWQRQETAKKHFQKLYQWLLRSLNFVDISIEKCADLNFVIT